MSSGLRCLLEKLSLRGILMGVWNKVEKREDFGNEKVWSKGWQSVLVRPWFHSFHMALHGWGESVSCMYGIYLRIHTLKEAAAEGLLDWLVTFGKKVIPRTRTGGESRQVHRIAASHIRVFSSWDNFVASTFFCLSRACIETCYT